MANIMEFKKTTKVITCKISGIKVEFKTRLSVQEYVDAINEIVSSCFTNNMHTPEYRTLGERYVMLAYFTDIDVTGISLEDIFEITQDEWFNQIEERVIGLPIYNEIIKAVDETIEYRRGDMYQLSKAIETAANSDINSTIAAVNETIDKANNFDAKKYVDAAVEVAMQKAEIENGKSEGTTEKS